MQEENNSNIYLTPEDRKPHEEEVVLTNEVRENDEQAQRRVLITPKKELTKEDIELKNKKKNAIIFSIVAIINLALFAYIIYLVISIFANLA